MYVVILFIILLSALPLTAQQDSIKFPRHLFPPPDSVITFADSSRIIFRLADPPTPTVMNETGNFWGFSVLFSEYGFGLGFHFQRPAFSAVDLYFHLDISGIRKTDEFEYYDPEQRLFLVPNKINRLYTLPLTTGIFWKIAPTTFSESFQPFFQFGLGTGIIISMPYRENRDPNGEYVGFFRSIGDSQFYLRPALVVGIGTQFASFEASKMNFALRYYYIPFGKQGLESVVNFPITNFGGIFLSLTFLLP